MSLGLQLHPFPRFDNLDGWRLGVNRLYVENDGWAHVVWESHHRKLLPPMCKFDYYHDEGSGIVFEDEKGPLTWMTAGELLALPMVTPIDNQEIALLPLTKLALTYLGACKSEMPVILYFH